jgi:hypothetical protein
MVAHAVRAFSQAVQDQLHSVASSATWKRSGVENDTVAALRVLQTSIPVRCQHSEMDPRMSVQCACGAHVTDFVAGRQRTRSSSSSFRRGRFVRRSQPPASAGKLSA